MKNDAKTQKPKSLLKEAVDKTDDVKGQFKTGLGAIKGNEKQKFVVPDTRKITGSLDIDTSTKENTLWRIVGIMRWNTIRKLSS